MPSFRLARLTSIAIFVVGATACATGEAPVARPAATAPSSAVAPCVLKPLPTTPSVARPAGTSSLLPPPPAYPAVDHAAILAQARCLSDALERYIDAWLDGRAPAEIPDAFIPPGVNRKDYPRFRLVRADEIRPQEQWAIRPAQAIDTRRARGFFPDPNVSYLVLPAIAAPFGHRLVVEGEFPHARYMSLQMTPSFDPASYRYDGGVGVGEVPIVDADIEPLPGHVNPFRVGAARDASRRGYRVVFHLAIGDPVALNPSFRPPFFRDPGNRSNERHGGALLFQGPWGAKATAGHGRGQWDVGQLWLRYYRPDVAKGPLAGVALPRAHLETRTGRRYYIAPDLDAFVRRGNAEVALSPTAPMEPTAHPQRRYGPEHGWFKQAGIFRAVIGGLALNTGWAGPEYVRLLDKGVAGRGFDLAPPNNYEQSATSATHVDYLVRGMSLGRGKVAVLTGRLPTFPATRSGDPVMVAAQMRYWSLVGYEVPGGWSILATLFGSQRPIGLATHAVVDEDIVLDAERNYVIVLSRPEDRPANATPANGVTWVDWGPVSEVSWTVRWLTVGPEWTGPSAPTPGKLGSRADWAAADFDPRVISTNTHDGAMGPYLPRVHYLSRAEFEQLGPAVTAARVPVWRR